MRIIAFALCIFVVCSICAAEETDYFDWKGGKLLAAKNYTGALTYFGKAIDQDPNFINAYVHIGDTKRAQKDYNASLESYNKALQLNNKTKTAWLGIIEAYVALNNNPEASDAAAKLTAIEPTRKENWLKEGNLLQMQGLYDMAAEKYKSALDIDPQYKDALYRRAVSFMAIGNDSGAMELLDRVLAIDAKYKQAYNVKGLILEAEGKYADAQAAYNASIEIDPSWSMPRVNEIHALFAQGKPDDAMKIFVTV